MRKLFRVILDLSWKWSHVPLGAARGDIGHAEAQQQFSHNRLFTHRQHSFDAEGVFRLGGPLDEVVDWD
jgi:hypothetical protein